MFTVSGKVSDVCKLTCAATSNSWREHIEHSPQATINGIRISSGVSPEW